MTGDILDSDVEYARRLVGEGRTDKEIATALGIRGIKPADATKLVADLRSGRRIRPNMILLPKRAGARSQPE